MPTGSSYYTTIPSITVAELLLKYLKLEGVDRLFGVPGAAVKHILVALMQQRKQLEFVVCKHETGAGYVADGYSRVTGKLAVTLMTAGPGATNGLTGAMNAQACGTPMLNIAGEQAAAFLGKGWEQEGVDSSFDVRQIYKSAVAYSVQVTSPLDFQTLIQQALRYVAGTPSQTAHLSIGDDVASTAVPNVPFPKATGNYRAVAHAHDPARTRRTLDYLVAARRPLILLGNGARRVLRGRGLAPFVKFVEKFSIPVMSTNDGKALFPESHPLSLRTYGIAPCEWPALYMQPPKGSPGAAPYDCLLVLGSTLNDFSTNDWDPILIPKGPFVQVDASAFAIARSMPIELGIVAELGAFLGDLYALAKDRTPNAAQRAARLRYLAWLKQSHSPYANPKARESDRAPIRPERVMAIISAMLPRGSHIFVDAGNSCGWCGHYLDVDPPSQVHPALDVGAMGYGASAVVGGKIGAPEATCVAVGGDGSFLMHGAEVSTAHQYKAGAIWVVWNDNDLEMVSQGLNHYFPDPKVWTDYYKLGKPDLVKYAEGLGAEAIAVRSPAEFERAFARAIAGGKRGRPQVIVVHHDRKAMPPFYPPAAPTPAARPARRRGPAGK